MGVRCFVAAELEPSVVSGLTGMRRELARRDPSLEQARWVRPENLHVTLAFFGEVDHGVLGDLSGVLDTVMRQRAPITLDLLGVAAKPSAGRCRMLWAALSDPTGECERLAERLMSAAEDLGVPREDRSFKPHVTLCRLTKPRSVAPSVLDEVWRDAMGAEISMSVPSVTFYSSRLTPRGPIYTELDSWSMRGE